MLVHPETVIATSTQRGADDARTEDLREALTARRQELETEHAEAVAEMTLAGVVDAGDDVADLGTKAFNREQEFALALSIRSRMDQVDRALDRLAAGRYGTCETCSEEIPVARLAAFPSVTLCVACKSISERR
ncbi:TraR/DksA C4-type zinc finger protein [Dactylosporangium fulvum]|uniref:TraR/DksA family transcriptional regulator n=1 Tax=Dactylosporangium fulvum TaxID=53359 RepID=A0ABY5VXU5_9ACTN|nr:TraR/DksA family transcriptional regulator [Dactylosporangium fulvum]UWP82582.1 TraR/DksA family transcriptional regulator [Dactylosporangium fulvum]